MLIILKLVKGWKEDQEDQSRQRKFIIALQHYNIIVEC